MRGEGDREDGVVLISDTIYTREASQISQEEWV